MNNTNNKGYDTQEIHFRSIALIAIASIIVFGFSLYITYSYYLKASEASVELVLSAPQPEAIVMQKQINDKLLHTYGIVDGSKKIYRIPIDRAIEIISTDKMSIRP